MSEVYKIQVNDSEPIEVSQQVYEVSFCFNEMLKEKDKEIERLNNIRNEAIKYVEESYNVTVEGIEGVAEFFSKRNEILSKILKGEDKE